MEPRADDGNGPRQAAQRNGRSDHVEALGPPLPPYEVAAACTETALRRQTSGADPCNLPPRRGVTAP
jgi:hypothetical protein